MSSLEFIPEAAATPQSENGFSALELQVLRMARSRSERPSGGRGLVARVALGKRVSQTLADPRLEALRSYAATVRSGRRAPRALLENYGFTPEQIASVDAMMRRARSAEVGGAPWMYHAGVALGMASMVGFIGMTGALVAGI